MAQRARLIDLYTSPEKFWAAMRLGLPEWVTDPSLVTYARQPEYLHIVWFNGGIALYLEDARALPSIGDRSSVCRTFVNEEGPFLSPKYAIEHWWKAFHAIEGI